MTLIVAKRFDDLTYLIADTSSSIPMTQETNSPIANPICKILVYRDAAVAFSGNTFFLPDIVKMRDLTEDLNDFRAVD
jgi:hypothetical protein